MIAAVPITTNCPRCAALVGGLPDPVTGNLLCNACGSRFDPRQGATAASSAAPVAVWQPAAGDELPGGYYLEREIGRGGMATVWQAHQASLARKVAVKILHAHLSFDVDLRRRFLREAEAMVQLDHPHIVPVLDRGENRERPFLVTALVGPRTLRDEIKNGRLSPTRVSEIAQQVLAGLVHAHDKGLIHRDIKPENILISENGKVHIADFGIAQVARSIDGHTLTQLTGTNVIMGTVAYMSPEQSEAKSFIDHRCDLYSLGVLCYEALVGHRPVGRFEDPSSRQDLTKKQGKEWDKFLLGLLERDPDKRIPDAKTALSYVPTNTAEKLTKNENRIVALERHDQNAADAAASFAAYSVDDKFPHGQELMRSQNKCWMGGVCGGLATWLGVSPGWIRVCTVVMPLAFGAFIGLIAVIICYITCIFILPRCPDDIYKPKPVNYNWVPRTGGWFFGVCDALGRVTPLKPWMWRILAIFTVPFGSFVPYLALGIGLPKKIIEKTTPEKPRDEVAAPGKNDIVAKSIDENVQAAAKSHGNTNIFYGLLATITALFTLMIYENIYDYDLIEMSLWSASGLFFLLALVGFFRNRRSSISGLGGVMMGLLFVLTLLMGGYNYSQITMMKPKTPWLTISDNMTMGNFSINGVPIDLDDPDIVTRGSNNPELDPEKAQAQREKKQQKLRINNTKIYLISTLAIALAALLTIFATTFRRYQVVKIATAGFIGVGTSALVSISLLGGSRYDVIILSAVSLVSFFISLKMLTPLFRKSDDEKPDQEHVDNQNVIDQNDVNKTADAQIIQIEKGHNFELAPTLLGLATVAGMSMCLIPLVPSIINNNELVAFRFPHWALLITLVVFALICAGRSLRILRAIAIVILLGTWGLLFA